MKSGIYIRRAPNHWEFQEEENNFRNSAIREEMEVENSVTNFFHKSSWNSLDVFLSKKKQYTFFGHVQRMEIQSLGRKWKLEIQ